MDMTPSTTSIWLVYTVYEQKWKDSGYNTVILWKYDGIVATENMTVLEQRLFF